MNTHAQLPSTFTYVNPQTMNSEYLLEVAVPVVVIDGYTQADLIERVSLASSERDTNPQRGVRISSDLTDGIRSEQSMATEQTETNNADDEDEAAVFYETQIDESSLIAHAKLADDGVHGGYERANTLKESKQVSADRRFKQPEIGTTTKDSVVPTKARVSKTPTNSIDGDTAMIEGMCCTGDDKRPQGIGNSEETKDLSNDDDFCKLMDKIMVDLQDFDAEEIVQLLVGTGIVEEGLLTGYISAEQVITQLRTYRFISRDNLQHLQTIVMRLDDTEMYSRCVQYLKHKHDIVYFYQEQGEIPKGFGVVRCFIGCRDFTRFTREDLEILRFKVASLVFMPAHFFYIIGIEPGKRVVVSLMVLERYVDELHDMAKDGMPELNLIGIEAIQINDRTYSTAGRTAIDVYWSSNKTPSYKSVYRELREKCERIEEQDREIRDLKEELEFLQLEVDTVGAEMDVMTNGTLGRLRRVRSRSRSNDDRSRTRSLPPGARGRSRQKFPAVTSGLNKESNQTVVATRKVSKERQRFNVKRTYGDSGDVTTTCSSYRSSVKSPRMRHDQLTRQRFEERGHLMDEIQAILDEIAFVQSAI